MNNSVYWKSILFKRAEGWYLWAGQKQLCLHNNTTSFLFNWNPETEAVQKLERHSWTCWPSFQPQSMHVKKSKANSHSKLHTLWYTLCRPVQFNPVQYCTYHCGPLSPLICCQTGRPGRKPWRGSCVNHIKGKRKETEIWKEVKQWKQRGFIHVIKLKGLPQTIHRQDFHHHPLRCFLFDWVCFFDATKHAVCTYMHIC